MKFVSVKARMGVAGALVPLSLIAIPQVASATTVSLFVSPSGSNAGSNCRSSLNPCQTIGYALSVAPLAATIQVQAGTYPEQLSITKAVTIVGAGASKTIIAPTAVPAADTDTDSSQPQFAIVDISHASGVNLNNLKVSGAAATASFDNDGDGCAQDPVGVYFHDARGSMTNDVVTGIDLPPDLFGCQGGQGVYAATDSGAAITSTLTMTSDSVNNYDKNGITCDDPGTSCTVRASTVTGIGSTTLIAQNGIQIWAAAGNLVSNTVSGNTYDGPTYAASGILVGNPYTLTMSSNALLSNDSNLYVLQAPSDPNEVYCGAPTSNCTNPAAANTTFSILSNMAFSATNTYGNAIGSGYGDGIDLDSLTTPSALRSNTVVDNPGNGIALYGASGVAAQSNSVIGDGNGVYLGSGTESTPASGNTLLKDRITSAVLDGIEADTASSGNTFQQDTVQLNGTYDVQDNTAGAATDGTANYWRAESCSTSNPAGLCYTPLNPSSAPAASVPVAAKPGARSASASRISAAR